MADPAAKGARSLALPKPPGYERPRTYGHPQHPGNVVVGVPGHPAAGPKKSFRKRKGRSCCCMCCVCCVWTAFMVVVLLLLVALAAAMAAAWYQPKAPEFMIERLDVSKFDLKGGSGIMSSLDANVDLSFTVLNKNEKIQLSYGALTVQVATEYTSLGRATAPAFSQGTKNSTVVAVHTKVSGSTVGGSTGEKLSKKFEDKTLVLDVDASGEVTPFIDERRYVTLPFTVTCYNLDQGKVAGGSQPRCKVYLFGMIPLS